MSRLSILAAALIATTIAGKPAPQNSTAIVSERLKTGEIMVTAGVQMLRPSQKARLF